MRSLTVTVWNVNVYRSRTDQFGFRKATFFYFSGQVNFFSSDRQFIAYKICTDLDQLECQRCSLAGRSDVDQNMCAHAKSQAKNWGRGWLYITWGPWGSHVYYFRVRLQWLDELLRLRKLCCLAGPVNCYLNQCLSVVSMVVRIRLLIDSLLELHNCKTLMILPCDCRPDFEQFPWVFFLQFSQLQIVEVLISISPWKLRLCVWVESN